jgi:hypothetical protein
MKEMSPKSALNRWRNWMERCYEYLGLFRDFEFKANEGYLRHSIKHIKFNRI